SSSGSSTSNAVIPLPLSAASATNLIASSLQQQTKTSSPSSSSNFLDNSVDLSINNLLKYNQRREEVCGRTIPSPTSRIIGGEGARFGEFPYQVHIKIAKHQCGGALVDRQSIVTAAHCVYHFISRAPVSKLQIVIGAYDIEDEQYQDIPPQYFKVNKVKLHPQFRFSASHPDRYDIAILKLDKPVKYTDNVLPVCLPSLNYKFENMIGTVTGFGKTDPSLSNRYGTRLLQKVDVPIIDNAQCERWHRTRGIDLKIFPEMMCAGYEDGLKDACVGDSGGPLVVKMAPPSSPQSQSSSPDDGAGGANRAEPARWTLAGITSAGFGCAQSRQPGTCDHDESHHRSNTMHYMYGSSI
ncbi:Serine proteinase stubble, partial [Fragariocoptes setiger]